MSVCLSVTFAKCVYQLNDWWYRQAFHRHLVDPSFSLFWRNIDELTLKTVLCYGYVWNKIISKLFRRLIIAHKYVSTCLISLKLCWNNFSGWSNFEIISDVVTCEIKHWNNFEIISVFYFTCNHGIKYRWLGMMDWLFRVVQGHISS